jgi:hypothetical protein
MIEIIADTRELSAIPALARCVGLAHVGDPADSLSCRAFEVLWALDREAARDLARSKDSFIARPNLSIVMSELEDDE